MTDRMYRNGMKGEELVSFAKEKALKCCKNHRDSIRLFADIDYAYYLFNIDGVVYIGSYAQSESEIEMIPFFLSKTVYYTDDRSLKVQELIKINTEK